MLQVAPRDATKISVSVNKQGIFTNMVLGKVYVVLGWRSYKLLNAPSCDHVTKCKRHRKVMKLSHNLQHTIGIIEPIILLLLSCN